MLKIIKSLLELDLYGSNDVKDSIIKVIENGIQIGDETFLLNDYDDYEFLQDLAETYIETLKSKKIMRISYLIHETKYIQIFGYDFKRIIFFNFQSEELEYTLEVKGNPSREPIFLLDKVSKEEFYKKADNLIKEFLLNDIASSIELKLYDLDLNSVKVKTLKNGLKINDKLFNLNDYDYYDDLQEAAETYIETLK